MVRGPPVVLDGAELQEARKNHFFQYFQKERGKIVADKSQKKKKNLFQVLSLLQSVITQIQTDADAVI